MIQTYSQLKTICEEYNSLFQKNELCLVQKAYTTPHFLALSIRFPGKTVVIYIGRGSQYQGVFLGEKMPPSYLRIQDRFLDYIRKYLVGTKLSRIEIDNNKMLLLFKFYQAGIENKLYLGWHNRHLYFDQKKFDDEIQCLIPNENNLNHTTWTIENYFKLKNSDETKKIIQRKKEKFLVKKIKNIKLDLEKNAQWKMIEKQLAENTVELSKNEIVLYGQKIKFLQAKNEWQKKDQIYKKIKKMRSGEAIQIERLKNTETEYEKILAGEVEYEVTKEAAIQPCWPNQKKAIKNSSTNIKKITIKNLSGVVGLNSEGNDAIRIGENKNHFWFHLENYSGAHCIVKTDDISLLLNAEMTAIASMLRDLSHLDISEIPMIYTQLKYIKGVKGASGKVIVNKAKHLRCNYMFWKDIIYI